jgi:hypothetical protein
MNATRLGLVLATTVMSAVALSAGARPAPDHPVPDPLVRAGAAGAIAVESDAGHAGFAAGLPFAASLPAQPGYTIDAGVIGEAPTGFQVWVAPSAPHRAIIAANAAAGVAALRALGLAVTWRGYGNPAAAEGIITIGEGAPGCEGGPNVVGNTWPYEMGLPNGERYMYRSTIVLCPQLFTRYPSWEWRPTVLHELGHAMGLAHTNYWFDGAYQLMNAINHPGVYGYRAGDSNGLRLLATHNTLVRSLIPPIGAFDRSTWQPNGTINLAGWALLKYQPSGGVVISVTDNGKLVARSVPRVFRPDVNRIFDPGTRRHGYSITVPWLGGIQTFCVTATSAINPIAAAEIGCVTWRG